LVVGQLSSGRADAVDVRDHKAGCPVLWERPGECHDSLRGIPQPRLAEPIVAVELLRTYQVGTGQEVPPARVDQPRLPTGGRGLVRHRLLIGPKVGAHERFGRRRMRYADQTRCREEGGEQRGAPSCEQVHLFSSEVGVGMVIGGCPAGSMDWAQSRTGVIAAAGEPATGVPGPGSAGWVEDAGPGYEFDSLGWGEDGMPGGPVDAHRH